SVTSSSSHVISRPAPCRSAAPSAGLRTPAKTWYPLTASRSAVARPMPDEAPVTRTWGGVQLSIVPPPRRLLGGRPGHSCGLPCDGTVVARGRRRRHPKVQTQVELWACAAGTFVPALMTPVPLDRPQPRLRGGAAVHATNVVVPRPA